KHREDRSIESLPPAYKLVEGTGNWLVEAVRKLCDYCGRSEHRRCEQDVAPDSFRRHHSAGPRTDFRLVSEGNDYGLRSWVWERCRAPVKRRIGSPPAHAERHPSELQNRPDWYIKTTLRRC